MSNVIGPFTETEWRSISLLKQSINYLKSVDAVKYQRRIAEQKDQVDQLMSRRAA